MSVSNLSDRDMFYKNDPMAVVYTKKQETKQKFDLPTHTRKLNTKDYLYRCKNSINLTLQMEDSTLRTSTQTQYLILKQQSMVVFYENGYFGHYFKSIVPTKPRLFFINRQRFLFITHLYTITSLSFHTGIVD